MDDPTSLLFGLDEFAVLDVSRVEGGEVDVRVVIETVAREAACPSCGVFSGRIKDRSLCRIKDLPASGQRVALWWRQRRFACTETTCERRSFVEHARSSRTPSAARCRSS